MNVMNVEWVGSGVVRKRGERRGGKKLSGEYEMSDIVITEAAEVEKMWDQNTGREQNGVSGKLWNLLGYNKI